MAHLDIKELAALVVGVEDRLILHVEGDEPDDSIQALLAALDNVGLKERTLVVVGEGIKAYKVEA